MEQARYWMWAKRKHNSLSSSQHDHLQVPIGNPSNDDSWEEQAFAEDAAGPLGGCIWPPRSYSCSFCRREFRSAQALGGHMNVHRRDRARLKQSPNDETTLQNHHHLDDHSVQNHNPFSSSSLGSFQYPSHQVCALVYNPNNPSSDPGATIASSSPSSGSRVSAQLPCKENCADQTLKIPPSSSASLSFPQSWSILGTNRNNYDKSVARNIIEAEKISGAVESGCRAKGDHHVTSTTDLHNLSVSLNLVVRCARPSVSGDEDEAIISCKRRRTEDVPSSTPFFLKSGSVDKVHHLQAEGFELSCTSSIEDLDLELRLGDRPKVIKVDK
ncbi:unnamed protein product [Prunus brigantina]